MAQGFLEASGRMQEDTGGNLWICSAKGLTRLDRRGMTNFDAADGLTDPNPLVVVNETRDRKLYIASANFFLSKFDGKTFQTIRPQIGPESRCAWTANTIFQDSGGGGGF
jgi:ligand-binding sensor domain-containing protein